ncbi:arsenite methyltransferase [Streptomyces sp. NPDC020192]|uniref:arsenite methyltransferase n=1 Tax=Streptomyces sp. NPDC020192 TaxID=3365066 RepID=UPI00379BAD4F
MREQSSDLRETVRQRYAAAAVKVTEGGAACCGPQPVEVDENFGSTLYAADERDALPAEAVAASLGCGNPTAVAELREGERVLDLGSGGGIDVLLSARRVGPTGKAYGVDMTDEMLALALANAEKAGATNVEFLKGTIESIPLPANTIDVVISNCVITLSVDKPAVFAETFRVLKPGGRIGVSDVVADDSLSPDQRAERGDYVGCIAGALSFAEYRAGLEAAGFTDIEITPTHTVADGMHSAIVRATKPVTTDTSSEAEESPDACCGVNACCTPAEAAVDPVQTATEAKAASGCGCTS